MTQVYQLHSSYRLKKKVKQVTLGVLAATILGATTYVGWKTTLGNEKFKTCLSSHMPTCLSDFLKLYR